jgi:hypothetical protein
MCEVCKEARQLRLLWLRYGTVRVTRGRGPTAVGSLVAPNEQRSEDVITNINACV